MLHKDIQSRALDFYHVFSRTSIIIYCLVILLNQYFSAQSNFLLYRILMDQDQYERQAGIGHVTSFKSCPPPLAFLSSSIARPHSRPGDQLAGEVGEAGVAAIKVYAIPPVPLHVYPANKTRVGRLTHIAM